MHPDPRAEIRLLSVRSLRGANYWTTYPVTRLDLAVGAYENISSADVPGVTKALIDALPGLIEHRCSIGERGGFVSRLRRGTYVPHIIEHVALELQTVVGDRVGYGRARGGDREGEYTVVVEHRHARLGAEAVRGATELVCAAFAGSSLRAEGLSRRLKEVRRGQDEPPVSTRIWCGILGSGDLESVRDELVRFGIPRDLTAAVPPADVLRAGLPYATSDTAIILDVDAADVPPRYREEERRAQIAAVAADAVPNRGIVVVPAKAWEVQELVREAGPRVAVFAGNDDVTPDDAQLAHAVARVRGDSILIECTGCETEILPLRRGAVPAHQAAAAMAKRVLTASLPQPAKTSRI